MVSIRIAKKTQINECMDTSEDGYPKHVSTGMDYHTPSRAAKLM